MSFMINMKTFNAEAGCPDFLRAYPLKRSRYFYALELAVPIIIHVFFSSKTKRDKFVLDNADNKVFIASAKEACRYLTAGVDFKEHSNDI